MIKNIRDGIYSSDPRNFAISEPLGYLFFFVYDDVYDHTNTILYRTDGTTEGETIGFEILIYF